MNPQLQQATALSCSDIVYIIMFYNLSGPYRDTSATRTTRSFWRPSSRAFFFSHHLPSAHSPTSPLTFPSHPITRPGAFPHLNSNGNDRKAAAPRDLPLFSRLRGMHTKSLLGISEFQYGHVWHAKPSQVVRPQYKLLLPATAQLYQLPDSHVHSEMTYLDILDLLGKLALLLA